MTAELGEAYTQAYTKRLQESGVAVDYARYEGMIHPFLNFAGVVDKARDAIDDIGAKLCTAFWGKVGC